LFRLNNSEQAAGLLTSAYPFIIKP